MFTLNRCLVFFMLSLFIIRLISQQFLKFELSTSKFKCTCQYRMGSTILEMWHQITILKAYNSLRLGFNLLQSKMLVFSLFDVLVAAKA